MRASRALPSAVLLLHHAHQGAPGSAAAARAELQEQGEADQEGVQSQEEGLEERYQRL